MGDRKKLPGDIKNNPIVYNTIRVWQEVCKYLGRGSCASFLTPIIRNRGFVLGLSSNIFDKWHDNGVHVIGDLYHDRVLMTFQQLQSQFSIPRDHFYGFLQIRHFVGSRSLPLPDSDVYSDIERLLIDRKRKTP